jgi:hypothetical protein
MRDTFNGIEKSYSAIEKNSFDEGEKFKLECLKEACLLSGLLCFLVPLRFSIIV